MNLKPKIGILFALVILLGISLAGCGTGNPPTQTTTVNALATGTTRSVNDFSELPKATASHVEVIYFHRSVRCEACLNAENYTRETLTRYFADQVKSGLITLQVLDMEKPENAALVKKFDASGSALYLSAVIQGNEYLCPNPDIWFYTSNKYLFVDTLRKKLASLVEGS
ncbi:MAG: hypothetical protein HZB51_25150 [Chloroflexi bacterium]|nr:hypothetical protein [Chloroflexota bacterium]